MMISAGMNDQHLVDRPAAAKESLHEGLQVRWYALHTSARHEKRVAERLAEKSLESYLPQYQKVARWKDRRVQVSLPLFPGYVFVRIALSDRLRVLRIPGVARMVGFAGQPVPLPEGEIEKLRNGLGGLRPQPHPFLTAGRRVQITGGPLAGMEGILVRRKGLYRVVLSLDLIQSSVSVDIDSDLVQPVASAGSRRNTIDRKLKVRKP